MLQRNATSLGLVAVTLLFSAEPVLAQSKVPTILSESVWEPDAPMAAALTCFPSSAPELQRQFDPITRESTGPPELKNRFLAVTAGDAGQQQAIRVTWDAQPNWPGGHAALVGQRKWMTEPFQVCENSFDNKSPPACAPAPGQPQKWFWAARLECDPSQAYYGGLTGLTDYCTRSGEACILDNDCALGTCGVDGAIHILDQGIVPSKNSNQRAIYSVQVIASSCGIGFEPNFSNALVVVQPIFGDVVDSPPTPVCPFGPPDGRADLIPDVTSSIVGFKNGLCGPKKTRIDFEPASLDMLIGITDILMIIRGFAGQDYNLAAGPACSVGG